MDEKLLDIQDLSVWYKTYRGFAEVVDHINLYVGKGEKIGLVGESGCGTTTTMKMVMRTLDERGIKVGEGSKLLFGGEDILAMDAKALLDLRRRKISMISQSPMAALNPVFTIGQQMMDVLKYSGQFDKHDKKGMLDAARKAIDSVMIPDPDRILNSYPHQLSGGMRQRICIATSLLTPRQLLIADEPGTALDGSGADPQASAQAGGGGKALFDHDHPLAGRGPRAGGPYLRHVRGKHRGELRYR